MSDTPPGVLLLDLQAQYRPLRAEILAAIERVCDSQRFIMGPEITALENEMAAMLGVRHRGRRGCGTGHRRVVQVAAARWAGGVRVLFILPQQEPRRLRRCGSRDDER